MSQSQYSICRDFTELDSSTKKKILPYIVSLYVYRQLENGDYMRAWSAVKNAIEKGYGNEYLERLEKYIGILYTLSNYIDQANNVFKDLEKIPSSYISYLLEKIESYYDDVRDILPEAIRENVEKTISLLRDARSVSEFYEDAMDSITRAYDVLNEFLDIVSRSGDNLDMLENAFGYARSKFPEIISKLDSLLNKSIDVDNPEMAVLRNRIKEMLENVKYTVKGFYVLSYHGLPIIGNLQALIYDLKNYGGDNVLANPYYRNAVRDKIKTILQNVKALKGNATYLEYPDEARSMMRELAEAIINILNSLKKELGSKDGRFVDVFEEAENASGVNLVDVQKPASAIPGLEEFVRDVAEKNELAFRSDPVWLKIIGAIGIIGSGALDNLTILLRPTAFWEQIEAIKTMLGNTAENIRREGVMGLGESAKALFLDMFGTPERALYTIGGILSAIAIAKAVEKLPLPTKWKAVLTDVLQADPVGLMISGASAIGVKSFLRTVITKPKAGKIIVDTLPQGFDDTVRRAIRESVGEATAKHIVALSDELSRRIAKMIRNGVDYTEIKNTLTDAVKKYGIENLVRDYSKYTDMRIRLSTALKNYIATEAGKIDDIARKMNTMELRRLIDQVPTFKILRDIHDIRRNVLPSLKEFLEKYRELLSEDEYKLLYKRISDLEEALRKGDLGETSTLIHMINSYALDKISLDTLKTEMITTFERLGMTDLMKKVENVKTVADFTKLLSEIDKALFKRLDPQIMRAFDTVADVFKTLEKTRLGKLFKSLRNKLMQKIMVRINEAPDPELSRIFESTLSRIDLGKLSPELKTIVEELREKASKNALTLKDLERFTEKLAETNAVKAGLIEAGIVNELLTRTIQHLHELERSAPLEIRSVITAVRDKLSELSMKRILPKTGEPVFYGRVMALNPIPLNLEYTLKTLTDYMESINPAYASKLKGLVEQFMKELGEGKVSEETLLGLFKELSNIRKVKGIKIGLLDRLKKAVKDYVEWLETRQGVKPEAIRSIRNLADIIARDIDSLKREMEKGWGFIAYKVGRARIIAPLLADEDTVRRFRSLMDNPAIEKHLRIGDLDIIGSRKAVLEPDGTFKIEYELLFPENRVLRITQITRPSRSFMEKVRNLKTLVGAKPEAEVDVYYRVYFDPEALDIINQNPVIYRKLVSGEIFSEIDPEYKLLDNIIVYRLDTPVSVSLLNVLKALPYLATIPTAVRKEKELPSTFLLDKLDLIELLSGKFPTIEVPDIPGIDEVKAILLPDDRKIIIGLPYSQDFRNYIIGWARLKWRDKTLFVPKLRIGTDVYYLIPPIELETTIEKTGEKLKTKTVSIPKEAFQPSEVPAPPPTVPIAGAPMPTAVGIPPVIGLPVKGAGAGGKRQYEEIRL